MFSFSPDHDTIRSICETHGIRQARKMSGMYYEAQPGKTPDYRACKIAIELAMPFRESPIREGMSLETMKFVTSQVRAAQVPYRVAMGSMEAMAEDEDRAKARAERRAAAKAGSR